MYKQTFFQSVEKIPEFYGTQRFITMFTFLSQIHPVIHSTPPTIFYLWTILCPPGFPTRTTHECLFPRACVMPGPSQSPWKTTHVRNTEHEADFYAIYFVSCYFLRLRPLFLLKQPIFEKPQPISALSISNQVSHSYEIIGNIYLCMF
jgi:hypothetical protein